jgi:ankyrin repeat protein
LSRAAEKDDKAVVELLLENGAQPDLEDENRCTALSRAIEGGHAVVVQLLLAQGAKVNYQYELVRKSNHTEYIYTRLTADTVLLYYCSK